MAHRRRAGGALLPALLGAVPLAVPAVAIAIRRPVIDWTGDRALTELAVREAARLHQLVGMGGRFGWRHAGPLWTQLLVPGYELSGHAPWSLAVGAIALHVVCAVLAVVVAARVGGRRAAALMAGAIAGYVALTGYHYWTNLWAGYAFTWPLLALVVVAAVAITDRRAGWAVGAAFLLGTLLVQTDVSMVVPVVFIGVVMIAVRVRRHRLAALSSPTPLVLCGLSALAWVPPIAQQLTTDPGNLTLLWRYGTSGSGGYPIRVAVATVGAALSVVPLGSRWVLENGVQAHVGAGAWWAVAWAAVFVVVLVVTAVFAARRGRGFAADLAIVTLAATGAAIFAVSRVDGPINFYLLTWMTILPVPAVVAVVLGWAPDGRAGWPVAVGLAVAVFAAGFTVATHGTSQDWDRIDGNAAGQLTAAVRDQMGAPATGLVRIHIATTDTWPIAAGVALQLERTGAHIEVDPDWVFLFGDAFRATAGGRPPERAPILELWFGRQHERPALTDLPQLTELATAGDVVVFARADLIPLPTW